MYSIEIMIIYRILAFILVYYLIIAYVFPFSFKHLAEASVRGLEISTPHLVAKEIYKIVYKSTIFISLFIFFNFFWKYILYFF